MTPEETNIRRGTIRRYIEAGGLVVVVDVPVIYAPEEPHEPLLEAPTIRLLDEITRRAEARDMDYLHRVGRVYELAEA